MPGSPSEAGNSGSAVTLMSDKTSAPPAFKPVPGVEAPSMQPAGPAASRRWRQLLWSEWFVHSRLLLLFLIAWLLTVWVLPLLVHPLWILGFGVAFALVAGPAFGGADVIDGCEEFMLSLPATRAERFVTRLVVGLGALLIFTAMDLLALGLNLADSLARLFLSAGLIQPVQLSQPGMLYGLVATVPLAIFAVGFAVAALTHSRPVAFTAWLWGSLATLATLRVALHFEEMFWERPNGRLASPLLLAVAVLVLGVARALYRRRESGTDASPLHIPLSWWAWFAAAVLAGAGVVTLLDWFAQNFVRLL
jgi:hypothetical protein